MTAPRRTARFFPLATALWAACSVSGWRAPAGELPPPAHAVLRNDASDEFFARGPIPHLRIDITGTNLTALRRSNRAYVRATVHEGETVYPDVGVHLKGAAGSFRGLDDRPALTLNFDKFLDRQKFHGLDKIHLNNSVQDASYMTEILCADLFLAAGVPAARGTYARVFLNGRDLGLYVLKEGFDKRFLRRFFKNANGNLYDGGFLREITEPLDKTSGDGDVADRADLKAVAAAAREGDPEARLDRLEKVLDLDRFISFIALEIMVWHWDGYAMKKNNYRVYHDPDANKVVFFPHGMDQMFWAPNGPILPDFEGMLARQVVSAPEGQRRYRERMAELLRNVFTKEFCTNRLTQLHARLRPELEKIGASAVSNHEGALGLLRNQIVRRVTYLEKVLHQPEPKEIQFDAAGFARLTEWYPQPMPETTRLARTNSPTGSPSLFVAVGAENRCIASWRADVLLRNGSYIFEGRARTQGVVPLVDQPNQTPKGQAAGIRTSRAKEPRANRVSGNTDWQKLEYPFQVTDASKTVELICELRASAGEAWFELDSLRLKRVSAP